jgi:hypothetical protein
MKKHQKEKNHSLNFAHCSLTHIFLRAIGLVEFLKSPHFGFSNERYEILNF